MSEENKTETLEQSLEQEAKENEEANILVSEEEVEQCLDKIRPYIQHDGGDIELLGIDEQNVAYVSFRGACAGCMMAADDFSSGIRLLLLDEVPGIRDVVLV